MLIDKLYAAAYLQMVSAHRSHDARGAAVILHSCFNPLIYGADDQRVMFEARKFAIFLQEKSASAGRKAREMCGAEGECECECV